jgi:hypothetical protein
MVMPDPRLGAQRVEILRADLPERFVVPGANLGVIVTALGHIQADTAMRDDARVTREETRKVAAFQPSTRWGGPLDQLLNILQVNEEGEIPQVWKDMARAGVKKDCATIQYHFRAEANQRGLPSNRIPICSPELAKDMASLTFEPATTDNLMSGLSIFALCHPDQPSAQRASELAGHYNSQMEGVTGLTLADSVTLKAAQELCLPTKSYQVKTILGSYDIATTTLLGGGHVFVTAFRSFMARAARMEYML